MSPKALQRALAHAESLLRAGRTSDAARAFEAILREDPNQSRPRRVLGELALQNARTFLMAGEREIAISELQNATTRDPSLADAWDLLCACYASKGWIDAAIDAGQRCVTVEPRHARGHNNLGGALRAHGRVEEALAHFQQSVDADPTYAVADSNLAYSAHYHPAFSPDDILQLHRQWSARHETPSPRPPRRSSSGKLRIGYVGNTFRDHPEGLLVEPIWRAHDRTAFDFFVYSDVPPSLADAVTRRLQSIGMTWRDSLRLSDAALADQIRSDGIDILIDLMSHMAGNRLGVFTLRPAPVQVSYMAYPATTGLTSIDGLVTDVHLHPAGSDAECPERLIRLPHSYWCYADEGAAPPPSELPCAKNSHITFGCLNSLAKMNSATLALWGELMRTVPGSRLLLLLPAAKDHNKGFVKRLEDAGLPADRLDFLTRANRRTYLSYYQKVDIALDPFPYGSHTTGLDGLWMGVPLISLHGARSVGRAGATLLRNLNLTELLAETHAQYTQAASKLAGDPQTLAALRAGLRRRMQASPLMDAPAGARALEAGLLQLWQSLAQP
jgi:predicted O-linked N-acetylglucosamine transferase (SPINDLY family)